MFVGGEDLASTLSFLLLGLVILALIVSIVVARARKRGSTTVALDVALTVSGWWLALSALAVVWVVVRAVTASSLELDAAALTFPSQGAGSWPGSVPCEDGFGETPAGGGAALLCSSLQPASLSATGISAGVRVLWAFGQVAQLLLWAAPAAMVAIMCFHTLRGRAFGRTMVRSLVGGAIAVGVLGVVSSLLVGVSSTLALREVFSPSSELYPAFQLGFSPVPLLATAGLLALAAVFRQGMRMQEEKAALQSEKERLEKDTEGLV